VHYGVDKPCAGRLRDVGNQVTKMVDGNDHTADAIASRRCLIDPAGHQRVHPFPQGFGRRFMGSQRGGSGGKDIATVKCGARLADAERRQAVRPEMPKLRVRRLLDHVGEQTVVRRKKQMTRGQNHRDVSSGADTRVNHRNMYCAHRKVTIGARQPKARLSGPMRKNFVGQIDDPRHGGRAQDSALHHADEGIAQTKVGGQRDDTARDKCGLLLRSEDGHGTYGIIPGMNSSAAFRLDGRVALVTGASSGIGQALALAFACAGARVALTARRVDRLADLAARIGAEGGEAMGVALDVTDRAAIASAFDDVAARFGTPDLILNNAGVAKPALFLKTDAATLDSTMATNFTAAWNVSQEAARRLVAEKRGGSIINITSVLGMGVAAGHAAYSASKAALAHATRAMALEFVRHGIRVNGIAPGWFVTEMNEDFFATDEGVAYLKKTPPGRAGRLEELVGPALLLASDAGSFVNGVILPVDGGHHTALV